MGHYHGGSGTAGTMNREMSTAMVIARVLSGIVIILALYFGPTAYGSVTSGARVDACLAGSSGPSDVVVRLGFVPGPSQLEELQRYGRYGGSDGGLETVVLLGVPPANLRLLGNLYWIDRLESLNPC
jgi:hypothetical protein